jgi:RNA polymerase-binding protein
MPRRSLRANRLVTTSNQIDRGAKPAPRRDARYWCAHDHLTTVPFAADVEPPEQWLCYACGGLAGPERGAVPVAVRPRVFPRTPYEFLRMRRTEADGDRLLAEAVADLRRRRRSAR